MNLFKIPTAVQYLDEGFDVGTNSVFTKSVAKCDLVLCVPAWDLKNMRD